MNTTYDTSAHLSLISASLTSQGFGIVRESGSSISNRHPEGMLITPAVIPSKGMTADDIVHVDGGGVVDGRFLPASDWRVHLAVYAARPDVNAVARLQSPAATALSSLRQPLPVFHHMVVTACGGAVRCAPYALARTDELATGVVAAMSGRRCCLMANNGLLVAAEDTSTVMQLAAEIEALCDQYLRACSAGDPVLLDEAETARLLSEIRF